MTLTIDAYSDTGCVREHNEDMILVQGELIRDNRLQLQIAPEAPFVFAVADGMGGHNGGEFASELAVQSLDEFVHALRSGLTSDELKIQFNQWIQHIHNLVNQKGNELPEFKNMGTTLVGMLLYEQKVFWFNVGDSRLYRFRGGILSRISTDHSMREMYDSNAPSNYICNSIGAGAEVFIDFFDITDTVFSDDVFVLCSDGLNDMVPDDDIESLLETNVDALVLAEAAKAKGGKDNVSVICVKFIGEEEEISEDEEEEIAEPAEEAEAIEITEEEATDEPHDAPVKRPGAFMKKAEKEPKSLWNKLGKMFEKE